MTKKVEQYEADRLKAEQETVNPGHGLAIEKNGHRIEIPLEVEAEGGKAIDAYVAAEIKKASQVPLPLSPPPTA